MVKALKLWLEAELQRVPPRNALADAISYALVRWDKRHEGIGIRLPGYSGRLVANCRQDTSLPYHGWRQSFCGLA